MQPFRILIRDRPTTRSRCLYGRCGMSLPMRPTLPRRAHRPGNRIARSPASQYFATPRVQATQRGRADCDELSSATWNAGGGTRTRTGRSPRSFKPRVSTDSTTPAGVAGAGDRRAQRRTAGRNERRRADSNRCIEVLQTSPLATWVRRPAKVPVVPCDPPDRQGGDPHASAIHVV